MHILGISSLLPIPGFRPDNDIIVRRAIALRKLSFDVTLVRPVKWAPPLVSGMSKHWKMSATHYRNGVVELEDCTIGVCKVVDINPPHLVRKHFGLETPFFLRYACNHLFRLASATEAQLTLYRPDVIHSEYVYPDGVIGSVLSRRFGAKFVITLREGNYCTLLANSFSFNLLRSASAVTTPSKVIAAALAARGLRHTTVIPHFAENSFFGANSEISQTDRVKFVTFCRLLEHKNIHLVLQALAGVVRYPWEYHIVGDGPAIHRLKKLCNDLHLSQRVTFTGKIPNQEIAHRYSNFDYMVMPSESEAFGIAYVEALAMGLALITIANSGIHGYLPDLQGIYYLKHPKEVIHLLQTLDQNVECDRGARSARREAAAQFSKASVLESYARFYSRL